MALSFLWKVSRFRYLGITAGIIFTASIVSAQTTRTWNGTVNFDWFNTTNWLPNGVPAMTNPAPGTPTYGVRRLHFVLPCGIFGSSEAQAWRPQYMRLTISMVHN